MSPMKELSLKEAAFTCRVQGLETRNYRGWGKVGAGDGEKRDARGKGGAMSIEGLVERKSLHREGRRSNMTRPLTGRIHRILGCLPPGNGVYNKPDGRQAGVPRWTRSRQALSILPDVRIIFSLKFIR